MAGKQFPIKLNEDERARLDELARATGRTRAQVVRELISQARPTGYPCVELVEAAAKGGR